MVEALNVKKIISKYILTDEFELIMDLEKSKGSWLVDKRNGKKYLDLYTMYGVQPIGYNHPRMLEAIDHLGRVSIQKIACSHIYTEEMAEFFETFSKIGVPDYLQHAFLIEGGAPAVENALKTAFDWKIKKNIEMGLNNEEGKQIVYLKESFHGRTGYALSVTDSRNRVVTKYFPRFEWPCILNPKVTYPLNIENLAKV